MADITNHPDQPHCSSENRPLQPLGPEILGIFSEDDYRRYPCPKFKESAIHKLHQTFAPGSAALAERAAMLAGFARLCDTVAASDYPLQAAFNFIIDFNPRAKAHLERQDPKALMMHLQEVSNFAKEFIVVHGTSSRFPNILTDREAVLVAYVAAPLHDLMKYLGSRLSQIMPDHEIMAAELVRRHFPGKHITLPTEETITLTHDDCVFLSSLIGDHENIEKEEGRTDFIQSESSIERAKALFFVLDTITGVLKCASDGKTWSCNREQLDARFTDLVYRHIDLVKGKIFRPAWAPITIDGLAHTVEQLAQHGIRVSGTVPGETFREALARSALRAIVQSIEEDKGRRDLQPPQRLFTNKQLSDIESARSTLERFLRRSGP
jgi:hypothetical protein